MKTQKILILLIGYNLKEPHELIKMNEELKKRVPEKNKWSHSFVEQFQRP